MKNMIRGDEKMNEPVTKEICTDCMQRKERFISRFRGQDVNIVTMGPYGTTSSIAADYLKRYMTEAVGSREVNICLYENFDKAVENLKSRHYDLIVLPNAYEKMTNFYWDDTLDLMMTFIIETPTYGLAGISDELPDKGKELLISTCKPVRHLLDGLLKKTVYADRSYEIVEAYSTRHALSMLENHEVDLALTNDTSLKGSRAGFISGVLKTEVLWSVFMYTG